MCYVQLWAKHKELLCLPGNEVPLWHTFICQTLYIYFEFPQVGKAFQCYQLNCPNNAVMPFIATHLYYHCNNCPCAYTVVIFTSAFFTTLLVNREIEQDALTTSNKPL